jgi:hypothetical protein
MEFTLRHFRGGDEYAGEGLLARGHELRAPPLGALRQHLDVDVHLPVEALELVALVRHLVEGHQPAWAYGKGWP